MHTPPLQTQAAQPQQPLSGANTSAAAQALAFEPLERDEEQTHASRCIANDGSTLEVYASVHDVVNVENINEAGESDGYLVLSFADAAALGRELLKAAGQDVPAINAQLLEAAKRAYELIANATGSWAIDGTSEMKLLSDAIDAAEAA